jgi:hypothetical protein
MMDKNIEKKIIIEGKFEDVVELQDHYYIISKKNRVVVLPYTIDSKGLLDKIGVIKDYNYISEDYDYTLLNGYINTDDGTKIVTANRILYDSIGLNVPNAAEWMYLGNLYNNLTSDSGIDLYCVNISDKEILNTEEIQETKKSIKFNMIDSSHVITSDDTLLLASYLRLFNYFYVISLEK